MSEEQCRCDITVQVLVLAAYGTPNQDMAFVLGVTYNVLSSLLCGVWVTIDNLVTSHGSPEDASLAAEQNVPCTWAHTRCSCMETHPSICKSA